MKTTLYFRRNGETEWNVLDPLMMVWMLQKLPDVVPEPLSGEGTERSPWTLSTIGQWAEAASQTIAERSAPRFANLEEINRYKLENPNWNQQTSKDLYLIGGHLLERNPTTGAYANYITDVADASKAIDEPSKGTSASGRTRSFPAHKRDEDPRTVYAVKADRLVKAMTATGATDQQITQQARELMKGSFRMRTAYNPELPGTLGAIFIAEVAREKRMLPLGLMLLDLIECGVKYGERSGLNKQYTWEKLMMNPDDPGDRRWGGKHPMLHDDTQIQARRMFEEFNAVTHKSVSILTAWLSLRLRKTAMNWEVTVGTQEYLRADQAEVQDAYDTHEKKLKSFKPANEGDKPPQEDLLRARELIKAKKQVDKLVKQLPGVDQTPLSIKKKDLSAYDNELLKAPKGLQDTNPYAFYEQLIKPALLSRVRTLDCLL